MQLQCAMLQCRKTAAAIDVFLYGLYVGLLLAAVPFAGEMSEWLKEHDWKSCVGVTPPWVRIPLSPFFIIVVGITGQNRRSRHVRDVGAGKSITVFQGP